MINVTEQELTIILAVIEKYIPNCEVRAFGSRIKGKIKAYSDLDLAIVGQGKLDSNMIFDMKEVFQESELTFRVDLLDWYTVSPEFQKVIEAEYEVIFPRRDEVNQYEDKNIFQRINKE